MKRILFFLITAVICWGCYNESDASIVAIFAKPSTMTVNSGEMMYFDVSISTLNDRIESVEASTFDSQYGVQKIFSATPETAEYKERLIYEAPYIETDSMDVEFIVRATDNTGAVGEISHMIMVKNDSGSMLPEYSSIVLYSPFSGKNDAFSFSTLQPLMSSDTTAVDLHLICASQEEYLPLGIGTKTDMVFVKANNFDYSSATWGGLSSVFKNSIRNKSIENISIDDVIIVGREQKTDESIKTTPVGVIKIMAIYDDEGALTDRVSFNLKTIKK